MRRARVCVDGAVYHVVARTNRKEMRMDSAMAKDMFLEVLFRAKEKHCFAVRKDSGRLWGGRNFSRPIQGFGENFGIYEYIDQNPVRDGLAEKAADWKHGGPRLQLPTHCQLSLGEGLTT